MVAIEDAITDFSQWHSPIHVLVYPLFRPPLRCQLSRKGVVKQGGFTRFMGIEDGLHLFLGGIELGKQGLNTCDNALLFSKRRKWNSK